MMRVLTWPARWAVFAIFMHLCKGYCMNCMGCMERRRKTTRHFCKSATASLVLVSAGQRPIDVAGVSPSATTYTDPMTPRTHDPGLSMQLSARQTEQANAIFPPRKHRARSFSGGGEATIPIPHHQTSAQAASSPADSSHKHFRFPPYNAALLSPLPPRCSDDTTQHGGRAIIPRPDVPVPAWGQRNFPSPSWVSP